MARILLVEPDHLLAKSYAQALKKAGHKVTTAATAQSAIRAADAQTPDLVILELQLVEHSGIEFLYEFRSYVDWQNTPILIHSQVPPAEFNHSRDILTGQLGVQTYLYKLQTSLRELLTEVRETLAIPA